MSIAFRLHVPGTGSNLRLLSFNASVGEDLFAELGIGSQNSIDSKWRGELTPKSRMSRFDLNSCACTARVLAYAGRYLLILSALSLLTMPITEHLWTWDHFFQTGRDYELSTLMVLTFLCLVLVLSKQRKQCVDVSLSLCHILAFQFTDGTAPVICMPVEVSVVDPEPVTGTGTGMRGFPLQI